MAIPNAEKLLKQIEGGNEVTAEQRRHVIAYLMAVKPERAGTADLAVLFGMPDRSIRRDKRYIREEKAAMLKEDDIGLVIADIRIQYENQVRDLERGKAACDVGSRLWHDYCRTIIDVELKVTKALQDLGYYPKNLGTQTIKKFEFRATVDKRDGSVSVRAGGPEEIVQDAEFTDLSEEERRTDEEARRRFDEEFSDHPKLPPAPIDAQRQNDSVPVGTGESNTPK